VAAEFFVNATSAKRPFRLAAADPLAAIFDDEVHSADEKREIIIGHSAKDQLLLVCFTERAEAIRIISARRMTRRERRDYEESRHH
jgi:hypothetical protein